MFEIFYFIFIYIYISFLCFGTYTNIIFLIIIYFFFKVVALQDI